MKNHVYFLIAVALSSTNALSYVSGNEAYQQYNARDERTYRVSGTLHDERDGQSYRTVKIGRQEWMAENLNFDTGNPELSLCNERQGKNCKKYGRLYEKHAALKVCPSGWKLPSKEDFEELFEYVKRNGGGEDLSNLLRSSEWKHGLDKFGFALLPGGYYHPWTETLDESDFYYERMKKNHKVGTDGFLWTSTFGPGYDDDDGDERTIYYVSEGSSDTLSLGFHRTHAPDHPYDECYYDGMFYFSVRCVRTMNQGLNTF